MANSGSGTVTPITISSNTAGTPITVGTNPYGIAVTPNGATAYVANSGSGTVTPITISSNTAGTPITVGTNPYGIAITPNGATAYVANSGSGTVTPITISSNTAGTPITVGTNPYGIAILPDQAPTASFTVTPAAVGSATSFNGSASGAPYGSITNYAWAFGDGATTPTSASPTTTHTYTTGGPFTATLTVTDTAGTSTTQVFTGQTVSNNGGPSALASQTVVLPPAITSVSPGAEPIGGEPSSPSPVPASSPAPPLSASVRWPEPASPATQPPLCTATSPAEAAGTVDLAVTTAGGTSAISAADKFSFGVPVVTAISPTTGALGGGTVVTIAGTGFVVGSTTAMFGGTAGTSVTCASTVSCAATSPAEAAGIVDLTVTTSGGTSATSSADKFTFGVTPVVTGVSPNAGPLGGGTVVTVTGTGFVVGASTALFGVTAGTSVTCGSTTSCTVASPVEVAGQVDLTVTTISGTSATSGADKFTYRVAPVITGISPSAGPLAGNTVVTITGTGL